jgi:hypothetical protein
MAELQKKGEYYCLCHVCVHWVLTIDKTETEHFQNLVIGFIFMRIVYILHISFTLFI